METARQQDSNPLQQLNPRDYQVIAELSGMSLSYVRQVVKYQVRESELISSVADRYIRAKNEIATWAISQKDLQPV
jgi:hypothetical protein